MNLHITYYAALREQSGLGEETLTSEASTPRDLYAELKGRHGFDLAIEHLKVAVNDEFCDWTATLADGDSVVFIPPVAGG